ncbi:hypothetical protein GEV33_003147 [Tenebrio molitor]|uniref:Uncharacterized protein n=1 Tax=Tenebrio molitor TaxID=7067 RepID=A0A8J6HRW6_TENMO|nr:hypothetical protein GEV33_003147 [Tenebrio molitor]
MLIFILIKQDKPNNVVGLPWTETRAYFRHLSHIPRRIGKNRGTGCYRGITSPSEAKKPIRDKLCRHRCRAAANVFKPFSRAELEAAHTWQPRRRPRQTETDVGVGASASETDPESTRRGTRRVPGTSTVAPHLAAGASTRVKRFPYTICNRGYINKSIPARTEYYISQITDPIFGSTETRANPKPMTNSCYRTQPPPPAPPSVPWDPPPLPAPKRAHPSTLVYKNIYSL